MCFRQSYYLGGAICGEDKSEFQTIFAQILDGLRQLLGILRHRSSSQPVLKNPHKNHVNHNCHH